MAAVLKTAVGSDPHRGFESHALRADDRRGTVREGRTVCEGSRVVGVLLGTSGWQYRSWRSAVYGGRPQKGWLEQYAAAFATVEVNNAFYRLPERSTFEAWRDRTPADFVVGVKASRFLTHVKRLNDPEEPVARFVDRVAGLGTKLGPVLLQLPPDLPARPEALRRTLALFPAGFRVAVEFRHETWFTDEVRDLLESAGAALCWADGPRRVTPTWRTADWGYVRFHEGGGEPHPCYTPAALDVWARRVAAAHPPGDDVYVYFNNDPNVCAVRDAGVFGDLAERAGLPCTRRPDPATVRVGPPPVPAP